MQEEVENKTLVLIVSGAKFSGRLMQSAIRQYLAHRKEKHREQKAAASVIPWGKQTAEQVMQNFQGVTDVRPEDPAMGAFRRIAEEHGVDYGIKRSEKSGKYLICLKAPSRKSLDAALSEFAAAKSRTADRVSVAKKLQRLPRNTRPADRERRRALPER